MRRHSPKRSHGVATSWEPVASWYREHLREERSLLREVVYPNALRALGPERGKRYLDVVCGEGSFAQLITKAGASVVGIDASQSFIRAAEKKRIPGVLQRS